MSNKIAENINRECEPAAEPDASNSLDSWLKRELQALYSETEREALPPGIAELAAELEAKLKNAEQEAETETTSEEDRERSPASRSGGTKR